MSGSKGPQGEAQCLPVVAAVYQRARLICVPQKPTLPSSNSLSREVSTWSHTLSSTVLCLPVQVHKGRVRLTTKVQDSVCCSPGVRKSQKSIQPGPEASVGLGAWGPEGEPIQEGWGVLKPAHLLGSRQECSLLESLQFWR